MITSNHYAIHLGISEDVFVEQIPLVPNHLNPNATWSVGDAGGCLFETYGEELAFIRQQDPRYVWTIIDGEERQNIVSGMYFVNRIGYLVSKDPVPDGVFIEVRVPSVSDDDETDIDVQELLAKRRQVSVIWSVEDVLHMRLDLDDDQASRVLQECRKVHDCAVGFKRLLVETIADGLFPSASNG